MVELTEKHKENFLNYLDNELICFGCGKGHEDLFMVDDSEWFGVVPKDFEKRVICWKCYCECRKKKGLPEIDYETVKLKHGPLRSKHFHFKKMEYTKEEVKECVNDLKRILKYFEGVD